PPEGSRIASRWSPTALDPAPGTKRQLSDYALAKNTSAPREYRGADGAKRGGGSPFSLLPGGGNLVD
ncbi:MAG: hypothetical protein AAGA65_20475, partial [Actinomycetota bacterium]